jgi:hypothetical protein
MIGLMVLFVLFSLIVPNIDGASGFMFVYFHLSLCFIKLLHVFIVWLI